MRSTACGVLLDVGSGAAPLAPGYQRDLSKRSALYATVARIDNRGNGTRYNVGVSAVTPGGTSSGVEAGLRHIFQTSSSST